MSGAYLFLPDGAAKSLSGTNNAFVVMKGEVRQSVLLRGPHEALVYQQINLDSDAKSLEIVTKVDVRSTSNFELAMRMTADDFKGDNEQFYTDLNGFQVSWYFEETGRIRRGLEVNCRVFKELPNVSKDGLN